MSGIPNHSLHSLITSTDTNVLSRFHRIPERDGHTERQTDGRTDEQTALLYQYRALVC